MDMENMLHIIFLTIVYLLDGLLWTAAYRLIPTKFFGIPEKPSKHRRWVFLAAPVAAAAANLAVHMVMAEQGMTPQGTSAALSFFFLIYWMFYLQEPGRVKRFVILIISDMLATTLMMLGSCLFAFLPAAESLWMNVLSACGQPVLTIGMIVLLSWFSARQRKIPMRFFQILSVGVFCVLVQFVLSAFELMGYEEAQSRAVVSFRVMLLYGDDRSSLANGFIVGALLVVAALFFVMLVRESEADYFQKKNAVSEYYLEAQKEHYAALTENNREIRGIRHDMKNHIFCLRELYGKGNYEELGRYLQEMDESIRHADAGVHVGNEIADAIIAEKQKKALEKGIAFTVDGDMSGVNLAAIDVCTIFSNVIDNAIEAVEGLSESKKKISLEIKRSGNFLLITEKNPVEERPELLDNGIRTTKKDKENHGFGIDNVKEAAAKYDGECLLDVAHGEDGYEFQIEMMIPI